MPTKSQQQDEMINSFVASIPTMQTDIALLKQDTTFLKVASGTQNSKSDEIIKQLGTLSVVSKTDFEQYKKLMDDRLKLTEDYIASSKPGINFSNTLVNRWVTFLILLLLTAAIIAIVGKFIPVGV